MKLYRIKNHNYDEKQVAADYEVYQNITSCTYVSEYKEADIIK